MAHFYTITSLDDLAGFFAAKSREMNEIAQKRTGLARHNYAGQAHAYNDAAIIVRSCKMEKKGKRRSVKQHDNSGPTQHEGERRTVTSRPRLPTEG